MKPTMVLTIFIILLVMSFMPIYPNPVKRKPFQAFYSPRVNLWRALS